LRHFPLGSHSIMHNNAHSPRGKANPHCIMQFNA
jgi:hypothetical protein